MYPKWNTNDALVGGTIAERVAFSLADEHRRCD